MNLKKLKLGQRIEVKWRDTITHDNGWVEEPDYRFEVMGVASRMITVGWFFGLRYGLLFLAASRRELNDKFDLVTAIPIGCIISVRKIK